MPLESLVVWGLLSAVVAACLFAVAMVRWQRRRMPNSGEEREQQAEIVAPTVHPAPDNAAPAPENAENDLSAPTPIDTPAAPSDVPKVRVWCVDVETTGLSADDRIVSLAAVEIVDLAPTGRVLNLIFDPGRKSHPEAELVHGYSDWHLRQQPFFLEVASEVHSILSECDFVVAHNLEFDRSFIDREFAYCGLPPLAMPGFCTMMKFRERFPGARSSLNACLSRINLARQSRRHGALEDAILVANLYVWLNGGAARYSVPGGWPRPTNERPVPAEPETKPRRKRRPRRSTSTM